MNGLIKIMAVALVSAALTAAQAEIWDGTSDIIWYNANASKDTFFISNGKELAGMSQLISNGITNFENKTIVLTDDIDLDNKSWTPVGDNSTTTKIFLGTFDGNGHQISNLTVSGKTYAGFFGYVGANGQIKNLVVNVASISGTRYSGGLVGYYNSTKAIDNCGVNIRDSVSASHSISDYYSGGLVGYANATIYLTNSYSTGNVSASAPSYSTSSSSFDSYSGGLLGYGNNSIYLTNSYSTGNVSASPTRAAAVPSTPSSSSGGLAGHGATTITIRNSYSTGNVSTSASYYSYSGGLVGDVSGAIWITNSYSTGNVSASASSYSYSGGLLGYGNNSIYLTNSYSTGNVSASSTLPSPLYTTSSHSGGLLGYANVVSTLDYCYASGTISATGTGTKYVGGIFGKYYSGTNTSVYYNSEGASKAAEGGSPTGILGLISSQLKKQGTFLNWDFNGIWGIEEDISTPFLLKWVSLGGDFDIATVSDQVYTGAQITPDVKIRLKSNQTVLTKDADYTVSYGANKNAAEEGVITITGIGDYSMAGANAVNFKILPKELTVTGAAAQNKIYDGTLAAEITGATLAGVVGGDDVSIIAQGAFDDKNVGTDKTVTPTVTIGGTSAKNYSVVQPAALKADITKRDLVVSLNPKITAIAVSDNAPNFAEYLSYDSFGAGDTKSVITGTTTINHNYVKGTSPTGVYPVVLQGLLSASNYNISYDNTGLALVVGDGVSISDIKKSDDRYGIRFANSVAKKTLEIERVILPNDERVIEIKAAIYDNTGNVVFATTQKGEKAVWNLTNSAGRNVADGGYLVIVEAKGVSGKVYWYSAKVGVKR